MNHKCPDCKKELLAEHSFCPNCGFDLRKSSPEEFLNNTKGETRSSNEIKEIKTEEVRETDPSKGKFMIPFFIALSFLSFSVFMWSYVFQNQKFNQEVFINRSFNHVFWLLLFPYLISFIASKPKRARAYSTAVRIVIILGIIFLFYGYSQVKTNQDPFVVRIRLKQPCIDNVIKHMQKYDLSYEIKNLRASKYCDCLLEKVKDEDMSLVGKGEKEFLGMITENYKKENMDCVEISLGNN